MPRIAALLLAWLLAAGAANAASATWTFTEVVRDAGVLHGADYTDPLPAELTSLGVGVGALVSGSMQFDPDARPSGLGTRCW